MINWKGCGRKRQLPIARHYPYIRQRYSGKPRKPLSQSLPAGIRTEHLLNTRQEALPPEPTCSVAAIELLFNFFISHFLDLGTRRMPRPHLLREKSPPTGTHLDRKLGGPVWTGSENSLPTPEIKPRFSGSPTPCLVTMPTH
jgi:hypothetical protein